MPAVDWTAADNITAARLIAMQVGHLITPSTTATVASTSSETEFAECLIPADSAEVGMVWRLKAWGTFGVTGTPTLTLRMRFGPSTTASSNSTWAQTGALTTQSGVTNRLWVVEQLVFCEAVGIAASWSGPIKAKLSGILAGTAPYVNDGSEITTVIDGTQSTTVDSTADNYLSLTATWSAASASNTLTCKGFVAEKLVG